MHRTLMVGAIAVVVAAILMIIAGRRVGAAPQIVVPSGEQLRFRLVGDEPIAGPDGRSVLPDWKVLVFEDVKISRCYVTFLHGGSESVAGEIPCADRPAR
jgi:hypothetical protein